MPSNNTQFKIALAHECYDMFAEGRHDPSARDIAVRYYDGRQVSGGAVDDVRKALSAIRVLMMDNHHEISVILLAQKYYDKYRNREAPPDIDHASLCLPTGGGRNCKAVGLLICKDKKNVLYQAFQRLTSKRAGGVLKSAKSIIMNGLRHNLNTGETGNRQLRDLLEVMLDPQLHDMLKQSIQREVTKLESQSGEPDDDEGAGVVT